MVARVDGEYPLAGMLIAAVAGKHWPVDGGWHRVPPWRCGLEAVVAFTGHAVLALERDVPDRLLAEHDVDGFGRAHDPRLVAALAGAHGWIDSLDVLLARYGRGGDDGDASVLVDRPDLAGHPRVRLAAQLRDDVRVLGYQEPTRTAVAIISRGIAGLSELSFELEPDRRGTGGGISLVQAALTTVHSAQLVVAAAAPGNTASLRTLLAAGFVPVASLQLFRRNPHVP